MSRLIVHTDGGCRDNPGPGAWGVVIKHEGETLEYSGFLPNCTNNVAEYRALEAACHLLYSRHKENPFDSVDIFADSQLVVEQVSKRWKVNDPITPYYNEAMTAYDKLRSVCQVNLSWVRREFNKEADALCNKVMDKYGIVCSKKGKRRDDNQ